MDKTAEGVSVLVPYSYVGTWLEELFIVATSGPGGLRVEAHYLRSDGLLLLDRLRR